VNKNRYLVDLAGYDYCHGYLCALQVLVGTMLFDEISIVRKGYGVDMEAQAITDSVDEADLLAKGGLIKLIKGSQLVNEPYGRRYYLSKETL